MSVREPESERPCFTTWSPSSWFWKNAVVFFNKTEWEPEYLSKHVQHLLQHLALSLSTLPSVFKQVQDGIQLEVGWGTDCSTDVSDTRKGKGRRVLKSASAGAYTGTILT